MICGEKSDATYELYGVTQFFKRNLQDNRILHYLALVRGESSVQRETYSDSKFYLYITMTGQRCFICGNTQAIDKTAKFYRVPADQEKRAIWKQVFSIREDDIKPSTRICSRHFPDGDPKKTPSLTLGKYSTVYVVSAPTVNSLKAVSLDEQLRSKA